ncbi:MAG: glycoside hydrolase family 3 C-terminal domain-containing protein [Bacteroidales bacterium]|nr:glycoside hydrolase family 3 C-terminal domain-containing protein [Bacteroidales bacterium]
MRDLFRSLLFLAAVFLSPGSTHAQEWPESEINRKIDSLLSIMTLEEKAGQMLNLGMPALLEGAFYIPRDTLIFDEEKLDRLLISYGAGSVQNLGSYPLTPEEWRYYVGRIQKHVMDRSRLKIPILYGIDAVHGANYTAGSVLFPQQINLAATFDTGRVRQAAALTAYDVRASQTAWNYAPMLDVARNPLWGRIYETFGEDSYLVGEMGAALIGGMQGTGFYHPEKVIACGKHFLAYGEPHNGKDRAPVFITEQMLREIHLPPFRKAIENGLLSIMVSGASVNGVPSHADQWLLTDILKEELGFKGVIISDWGEIDNLINVHQVAANEREAVKLSVLAGIDMCMEPYDESFAVHLVDLVRTGEVPESRVDDAVRRILHLKFRAGLFDDPFFSDCEYPEFSSEAAAALSLDIATESLTLLKNEGDLLPLSDVQVLVTGVAAHSLNYLNGGWSRTWSGQDTSYNDQGVPTIYEALQLQLGKDRVSYVPGTDYLTEIDIQKAVVQAQKADVIIACIGEMPATEKPSDIENLDLPEVQVRLVEELAKTGKPLILVMVQGRPRIIREIEPLAGAILMAYLPGNEGGRAIANVLLGKSNPSGSLPYTYPRYSGSIWTYDHLLSDERDVYFGLNGFTPQYEFGFGLSYTEFNYSNLAVGSDTLVGDDELRLTVELSNTGRRAGREAVLLFVSDELASVSPPVKKLKRFTKVELQPGEKREISFVISAEDLKFTGRDGLPVIEDGYFTIRIGDQQTRFYYRTDLE